LSSSTTFVLKTDYRAPSREQLFLGTGWEPTRDVRGAFISAPKAELLIENWALSRNFASELTFDIRNVEPSRIGRNDGLCRGRLWHGPGYGPKIPADCDGDISALSQRYWRSCPDHATALVWAERDYFRTVRYDGSGCT